MSNGKEVLDELRGPALRLREHIPEVWSAYARLHTATMGDGRLDVKTKELVALAIGVTRQCDGCIASHARGAARAGAAPEEVAEMLGVAVMMNGGPGTVYGPRAFDAFMEFHQGKAADPDPPATPAHDHG